MRRFAALAFAGVSVLLLSALVAGGEGQISVPGTGNRQPGPIVGACRHDAAATPADRARRDQALNLARAIHAAQGRAAERTRLYQPLAELQNLPPTPPGFRLRLLVDASGYLLSLKDERDPCHYGVFSDEGGELYEMSPQVPRNAT